MTRYLLSYADGPLRVGVYVDGRNRDEALEAFARRVRYMRIRFDPITLAIHEAPR